MTRKEQIVEYLKERNIPVNSLEAISIIEGIVWADEHPKSDMVNKQKFIKKTWQWLKSHIKIETLTFSDVWDISVVEILATDFNTIDEMEESFRKTMEE